MVKVKSISKKRIYFGIIEGNLVYFNPGETKDFPDTPIYSELIANAVDDGFLEIIVSDKKSLFSKKEDKKEPVKESGKDKK